ncbi:MAG: acetylxylan esterase [Actinomycetia bacterium]|nr:acetylxylan esterase [Actinomycetes bacterium]
MRERVKPDLSRPPDFTSFWDDTLAELARVPVGLSQTDPDLWGPVDQSVANVSLRGLQFDSLAGARINAYYLAAADSPHTIVHAHGYGSQCDVRWDWAAQGLNVLGVDIRGFGRSAMAVPNRARQGYVLTGIQSPETSILRGAVCDYIRATEVAALLKSKQSDTSLSLHGVSFAGGLALMAEALTQAADVLTVGVPTFGWVTGRHFYASAGSGGEVRDYLAAHPEFTHDTSLVLSYFDSMNFAAQVSCPTLVGLGLIDDVVPAKTVFAIANHLGGPHEVMQFPISHSEHPDEALWQGFDQRCVDLALHGAGPDFGKP